MTDQKEISDRDRSLAQKCTECPVCSYARKKQKGFIFWLVKTVEGNLCPRCRAYERVYGRKSYEPIPAGDEK